MLDYLVLLFLGLVAIGSGLGVIAFRNAVHSALSLTVNMISIAVCFLLLDAQFLFAAQILVYAGAIMVLFLFAVTLLAPKESPNLLFGEGARAFVTVLLGALAAGSLGWIVVQAVYGNAGAAGVAGSTRAFSELLLGHYALPFEGTAFVLLTAIIGAAILGKGTAGDDV